MAARDIIIGILAGTAAVGAMKLFSPKVQPAPIIRPVVTNRLLQTETGSGYAATQPDAAQQKLETIIESVEMRRVALREAFAKFAQLTDANFIIEWRALGDAQIGDDQPITISLRHVPARIVLKAILDQIGSEAEKFGYRVEDGIIRVSTVRRLGHEQVGH